MAFAGLPECVVYNGAPPGRAIATFNVARHQAGKADVGIELRCLEAPEGARSFGKCYLRTLKSSFDFFSLNHPFVDDPALRAA